MRNIFIVLFVSCFFHNVLGQDATSTEITFDHMALSVTDVNRSASFYKDVLKLKEITNKTKIEGIRWFSMGPGMELHLISVIKEPIVLNKAIHIALKTPHFDEMVTRLEQLKIPYSDWPGIPQKVNIRTDGIKQIFFQDPDGIWIEVNSVVIK
jgi:lactoylglutathione lyase